MLHFLFMYLRTMTSFGDLGVEGPKLDTIRPEESNIWTPCRPIAEVGWTSALKASSVLSR